MMVNSVKLVLYAEIEGILAQYRCSMVIQKKKTVLHHLTSGTSIPLINLVTRNAGTYICVPVPQCGRSVGPIYACQCVEDNLRARVGGRVKAFLQQSCW